MQRISYKEYKEILLQQMATDVRVRVNLNLPSDEAGSIYYKSDQGISYLRPDGFMGGLCRYKEGSEDVTKLHQEQRIKDGGYFLECFEGKLSSLYKKQGFKIVGAMKFNEDFAAKGWKAVVPTRPDVVFMSLYNKPLKRSDEYDRLYQYAKSRHNYKLFWSRPSMDKIIEDFHSLGAALRFCGKTEGDIKEVVEHEWGEAVYKVEDPLHLYITRTKLTKFNNSLT